jgi:type IV pilus assembly protein PilQ
MKQILFMLACCTVTALTAWAEEITAPVQMKPAVRTYTGEPMSMHFQNIEMRTALQLVSEFSGVNIIMSDSVSGNLSIRLKDVPWDQVLHTVLQTRGLGQQQDGNVIWVAPLAELAAREKARSKPNTRYKWSSHCRRVHLR